MYKTILITLFLLFLFSVLATAKLIVLTVAFPEKYEGRPKVLAVDADKIIHVVQYRGYTSIEEERFGPNVVILVKESLEEVMDKIKEAQKEPAKPLPKNQ